MRYRFDELTWPEIDEAAQAGRIPVLPVGSVEQHGPHLPLKTDWFACYSVAEEAARRSGETLIAMPVTIPGVGSRKTSTGVGGEPSRATAEKGKIVFEEAVTQLI